MMKSLFTEELLCRLSRSGVIASMTIEDPMLAVPAAKALVVGGIDVMELTLRTPEAVESLRRIVAEVPEILPGVGTILFPEQIGPIVDAGAAFGVAPGLSERIVKLAQDSGLPFAPGIVTPSELEHALELGCREMKFFPAEPSGGIDYMKSMHTPYAHLGVRFLPLGGLNVHNMDDYLRQPATLAIGGSWIATSDLIRNENWSAITAAAEEAARIVSRIRGTHPLPAGRSSS